MTNKDLSQLEWKQHSHISMTTYYLNTEVAEVNGKKFYRHSKTRRTLGGYGLGKTKVTYSETLESKNETEQAIRKMMELAYKNL